MKPLEPRGQQRTPTTPQYTSVGAEGKSKDVKFTHTPETDELGRRMATLFPSRPQDPSILGAKPPRRSLLIEANTSRDFSVSEVSILAKAPGECHPKMLQDPQARQDEIDRLQQDMDTSKQSLRDELSGFHKSLKAMKAQSEKDRQERDQERARDLAERERERAQRDQERAQRDQERARDLAERERERAQRDQERAEQAQELNSLRASDARQQKALNELNKAAVMESAGKLGEALNGAMLSRLDSDYPFPCFKLRKYHQKYLQAYDMNFFWYWRHFSFSKPRAAAFLVPGRLTANDFEIVFRAVLQEEFPLLPPSATRQLALFRWEFNARRNTALHSVANRDAMAMFAEQEYGLSGENLTNLLNFLEQRAAVKSDR